MRPEVIVDIVYSAYIQEYYIYFILVVLGYLVLIWFSGFIVGSLPLIKKMFLNNTLMNVLIAIPFLIGINKIIFNIDNADYFLEQNLFILLFIMISIMVFVYSGTKQAYENISPLSILKTYKFSLVALVLLSFFYSQNYFTKNYRFIKSELKHEVYNHLRNMKINNKSLYRLAKTMTNHFIKATDQQMQNIENEKISILHSFNQRMLEYDKEQQELSLLIKESKKNIKLMEEQYAKKIDIVDSEIDNRKVKLDAIYKEWKTNVENDVKTLDSLSEDTKTNLQLLRDNKQYVMKVNTELKEFNKSLDLLDKKLIKANENHQIKVQLLENEIRTNIDKIHHLSKNVEINKNSFHNLEKQMGSLEESVVSNKKLIENTKILFNKTQKKQELKKVEND